MSETVNVLYKYVDGAHFFVANDETSLGLCVSHSNLKEAYEAVGNQLNKLFKLNYNKDVFFKPAMSADYFVSWVTKQTNASAMLPSPGVAAFMPWQRELMAA